MIFVILNQASIIFNICFSNNFNQDFGIINIRKVIIFNIHLRTLDKNFFVSHDLTIALAIQAFLHLILYSFLSFLLFNSVFDSSVNYVKQIWLVHICLLR